MKVYFSRRDADLLKQILEAELERNDSYLDDMMLQIGSDDAGTRDVQELAYDIANIRSFLDRINEGLSKS